MFRTGTPAGGLSSVFCSRLSPSSDVSKMIEPLRVFQRQFVRKATAKGIDTAALSVPRGNGKSSLAAHILGRCLTPGDESALSPALSICWAPPSNGTIPTVLPIRPFAELEPRGGYQVPGLEQLRIGITHKPTNTRLRVLSSERQDRVRDCRVSSTGFR